MLTGKTALVTGGSRGIGAAVAEKLAAQGANLAVVYAGSPGPWPRPCAPSAPRNHGVKALAYRCDVADFAAVKTLVDQIKKEFGAVDILVNNAGVTQDGLLAMMKEESFDRVLDVDLKGAFNFIRHCTPCSCAKGGRHCERQLGLGPHRQPRPGQLLRRQGRPHRPDQGGGQGAGPQGDHLQRRGPQASSPPT